MSGDRTRTRERTAEGDVGAEFEVGLDDEGSEAGPAGEAGLRQRVGRRAKRVFSPRAFVAALLLSVGGLVAVDAVVPLPGAGLLGVFAATFLFGLVSERRRYPEATVAGGVTFGASALVGYAVIAALGGVGAPLAAVAGGAGALVGAVGNYFGRDLRDGLTRDV
jgi:hypothetical protein